MPQAWRDIRDVAGIRAGAASRKRNFGSRQVERSLRVADTGAGQGVATPCRQHRLYLPRMPRHPLRSEYWLEGAFLYRTHNLTRSAGFVSTLRSLAVGLCWQRGIDA